MQKNITTPYYHFFLTDEFSQWYPSNFKDERGISFNCAEQWMMYCKAQLFGDSQVMKKILETNDPDTIKQLGREVNGFNKELWDSKALTFVTLGNIMKFSQNPELWEVLNNTNEKTIVEAASYDTIWGIGLNAEDAVRINDPTKWLGLNQLGLALMETREFLRATPELIVSINDEEVRKFAFYDSIGQKTIRLNSHELAEQLHCTVKTLKDTLVNLKEDIKILFPPYIKETMEAKPEVLLATLNYVKNPSNRFKM